MKRNFEKYPNINIIEKEISALEKRLEKVRKVMHEVEMRKSIFFLLLQKAQQKIKSDFAAQILEVRNKYNYELKRAKFFNVDLKKIQAAYRTKVIELNDACNYQMEKRKERQEQDLEKLQKSFDICKNEEISVKVKIEELKIQLKERWDFEKPKMKERSKDFIIKIKEAKLKYKRSKKNISRECKLLRKHLIRTFKKAHPYYHFLSLRIRLIKFKNITKLNNNLYSLLVKLNEVSLNKIKGPRQDHNNYLNLKNEKRLNEAKSEALTLKKFNNQVVKTGAKLSNMKYVYSLKSAFFTILPLILLSSFFLLINNFFLSASPHGFFSLFNMSDSQLSVLTHLKRIGSLVISCVNCTFSIIIAAAIAWNLSKYYSHVDSSVIVFTTIICFVCSQGKLIGFIESDGHSLKTLWNMVNDKITLSDQWAQVFGKNQIIIGILVGMLCPPIMARLCIYPKLRIPLPNDSPPVFSKVFNFLLPVTIITLIFTVFSFTVFELGSISPIHIHYINKGNQYIQIYDIEDIVTVVSVKILGFTSNSLGNVILMMLIEQILWFIGIDPQNLVHGIVDPVITGQIGMKNQVFSVENIKSFLEMGGGPGFLAICISVLIFSKRREYRIVAWISMITSMFNISAPLAFGLPLTYNIVFIIPMILSSIFLPIFVWVFVHNNDSLYAIHGIYTQSSITDNGTYSTFNLLPFFVVAAITTKNAVLGVVFSFACVTFATIIYSPFIILTNSISKHEFIENMINEKQRERMLHSSKIR